MQCMARPDPGVVTVTLPDGDMLLLHHDTGQYYTLNRTAALIWQLMEQGTKRADISQTLCDRFDVSADGAEVALSHLIQDLKLHKLITISESRNMIS
jgi:hypothetical protein